MNLVRALAREAEKRMSLSDFDMVLDQLYGGAPSYTGKLVSQTTALQVSAVWACVRLRSNAIAKCPLYPYRRTGPNSREKAIDHYLWPLLTQEANPRMTAFRFKRLMQSWVDLWGNAYAEFETSGRGQVTALWPWRPDRVKIWTLEDESLAYSYKMKDGTYTPAVRAFGPTGGMLHLRGQEVDGVVGLSPIEVHRQAVGLHLAMTEYHARFYGNGARPLGVLQHPSKLSDKAEKNLRESWMMKHGGLENVHRLAILEEGMQYKEVGLQMVAAQFIEGLDWSVNDIARVYGVQPHKIADLKQSTNNNIEHQGMEFSQDTIEPEACNWEQEVEYSLLSPRERQSIFVGFDLSRLTMGDAESRGAYYTSRWNVGSITADEIREREGENPLPNGLGSKPRVPLNTETPGQDGLTPPPAPMPQRKPQKLNGAPVQ